MITDILILILGMSSLFGVMCPDTWQDKDACLASVDGSPYKQLAGLKAGWKWRDARLGPVTASV